MPPWHDSRTMQPSWKLVVEDLGRISRAEIEARPLLLFVGGNNMGKTYLASLLWGLLSLSGELPFARGEAHGRCIAWLEERFARREQEPTFEITPEVHADLVQSINHTLREQGAALAERTFNTPGFPVGKIELREVAQPEGTPLRWETFGDHGRSFPMLWVGSSAEEIERLRHVVSARVLSVPEVGWGAAANDANQRAFTIELLAKSHVLGGLGGSRAVFSGKVAGSAHQGPVFLPASRTGFMLTYRSLAQQIVGDVLVKTGGSRTPVPDLTAPAVDFVNLLVGLRPDHGAFPEEAAFLEQAIGGRFSLRSDLGLNEVLYEHTVGAPVLPMQLSSSLVTELAPVVLTLRHVSGYQVLIIEEPEAHLHPHVQRRLAQVIVRLIRKGLFVWITTHSADFCQQINNFLKIGALSPDKRAEVQAKLGYAEQDYLDLDDVGGYEFRTEGDRSVVDELKKTSQGLVIPTFNHELFALAKEMDYLDDLASGEA